MVVEIFSIVRDQEHILPLYFKHYNEIFDNPIFNIYDNGSIDNSIKICKEQKNCNITKVSYSKYINEINVTGLVVLSITVDCTFHLAEHDTLFLTCFYRSLRVDATST